MDDLWHLKGVAAATSDAGFRSPSSAAIQDFLSHSPLGVFCLLLLVTLGVPPLARRLHMPDLVGLLLAGIALGPFGLGWLHRESPILELLSQVGIVFLLFSAGLELDLGELRRLRRRSLSFGFLTLLIPVAVGLAIGLAYGPMLGGSTVAALLIGALMAAHTPLGYPLLRAYGVLGDEAVTVGLGGTVIADVGSFVLLAICVGLSRGDFDAPDLVALLLRVALYATAVVALIVSIGGRFLARTGNSESNQFLFVLLALLLAAISAELAGVEHVMGALLAGVAVNAVLPEGLAKDKVLFVGHVLFVPIFFIDLGLLVQVPAFLSNLGSAHLILALIAGVLVSKGLAATLVSIAYGYSGDQLITLWSLSIPHVASTLAAAFVGFRAGLISSTVLNAMMALMLVTAVVGPYLTQRAGRRLRKQAFEGDGQTLSVEHSGVLALERTRLRLMVPIANPANERSRLLVGARLLTGHDGELLPLVVVPAGGAEPDPLVEARLRRGRTILRAAEAMAPDLDVAVRPLLRIDDDFAQGITRAALEEQVDLLLLGCGRPQRFGLSLFGSLIDNVCRQAHCPVAVLRHGPGQDHPRRILVPVRDFSAGSLEQVQMAARLAGEDHHVEEHRPDHLITVMHLHDARLREEQVEELRQHFLPWLEELRPNVAVKLELFGGDAVEPVVERLARFHDLVILRSLRIHDTVHRRASSDRAERLMNSLNCSVMLISDPISCSLPRAEVPGEVNRCTVPI